MQIIKSFIKNEQTSLFHQNNVLELAYKASQTQDYRFFLKKKKKIEKKGNSFSYGKGVSYPQIRSGGDSRDKKHLSVMVAITSDANPPVC